ncbi:MAG: hypothetical protein ABIH49_00785 [archaeon]
MEKNKRGLSAIVITLILVLLGIVAVGVVWVVINNIVQSSSGQVSTGAKCLEISVTATSVVAGAAGEYDVTLRRSATGGDIGGVKMVLFGDTGNSDVVEFGEALEPLATKTQTITFGDVGTANKIEVTPYLTANDGSAACTTATLEF